MEAIDHVHLLTKELLNGRRVRLGHISHHSFNLITFGLRTALEPGQNILGTSSLEGRNGLASVQVDNQCVRAMPLAPGILINAKGSAKLARAATPTPLKGPAKHRALRETIATGQCAARAAVQVFLPHVGVEPFGPLHMRTKGLTLLPGAVMALCALKPPQMEPQHHRTFQNR